ncbi:hypothetical protein [Tellurirhabdus rosea]|uniref:hypothetical protein n=1 Tax=Tellurirhabdus rosea TaxID=2674997 RepID=UPI0022503BC3|nr:hypothetical protein [Tellurirhabdus rosea]
MKHFQRFLLVLAIGSLGFSCTRVVVVERQAPSRGYSKSQGYKKAHPHGMPPGQAKKVYRY